MGTHPEWLVAADVGASYVRKALELLSNTGGGRGVREAW